ncbi:MAG: hypothetical protein PHQ28_03140 [Mycobacterium sp.]|nr:hypothetical protein [Mycobacterium sp.]
MAEHRTGVAALGEAPAGRYRQALVLTPATELDVLALYGHAKLMNRRQIFRALNLNRRSAMAIRAADVGTGDGGWPVLSELTANPQLEATGFGVSTPETVRRRALTAGLSVVGSAPEPLQHPWRVMPDEHVAGAADAARQGNPIVHNAAYDTTEIDTTEIMHQLGCGRSFDETSMLLLQPGASSASSPR